MKLFGRYLLQRRKTIGFFLFISFLFAVTFSCIGFRWQPWAMRRPLALFSACSVLGETFTSTVKGMPSCVIFGKRLK